ncbi:MAG: hypothetical protein WCJ19_04405 [bacterium]
MKIIDKIRKLNIYYSIVAVLIVIVVFFTGVLVGTTQTNVVITKQELPVEKAIKISSNSTSSTYLLSDFGIKIDVPLTWVASSENLDIKCKEYDLKDNNKCDDNLYSINNIILNNQEMTTSIKFSAYFPKKGCASCEIKDYPYSADGKKNILRLGTLDGKAVFNYVLTQYNESDSEYVGIIAGPSSVLKKILVTVDFTQIPNEQDVQTIVEILRTIKGI